MKTTHLETPGRGRAVLNALLMRRSDLYSSPRWRSMARYVRERDRRTCRHCKRNFHDRPFLLHVHHYLPWYRRRGLSFTWAQMPWNLVTLCESCHSKAHNRDLTRHHQ